MSARKRHTVRFIECAGRCHWEREAPNRVRVAESARSWHWSERSNAVRAAKSEARLTGARLVIDGQEVTP